MSTELDRQVDGSQGAGSGGDAGEDAYAKPTDRYGAFYDTFRCLLADASFDVPTEAQGDLFEEGEDVN